MFLFFVIDVLAKSKDNNMLAKVHDIKVNESDSVKLKINSTSFTTTPKVFFLEYEKKKYIVFC